MTARPAASGGETGAPDAAVRARAELGGFDSYAEDYEEALQQGLSVSGEDSAYFARGRIDWVRRCLDDVGVDTRRVLDFGCGTGTAAPFFLELLGPQRILGVDVSRGSIAVATRTHGSERVAFRHLADDPPRDEIDLAFCNGVFHHIPPTERRHAAEYVHASLRPGGVFAFWENNPWNPGTRYVMSRIPFDRDAIMLSARAARRLLETAGFTVLRTDYLFIFPHALRWFRPLETPLASFPLGAQYQVLARKSIRRDAE